MARPGKLKGVHIDQILDLVNRGGQKHAAKVLGVEPASISRRMAQEKCFQKVVWVKEEKAS